MITNKNTGLKTKGIKLDPYRAFFQPEYDVLDIIIDAALGFLCLLAIVIVAVIAMHVL